MTTTSETPLRLDNLTSNTDSSTQAEGFHPGYTTLISCALLIFILIIYMWFEPKVTKCFAKDERVHFEPETSTEENQTTDPKSRLRYVWTSPRYQDAATTHHKQQLWTPDRALIREGGAVVRVNDYTSVVEARHTTPLVFVTPPV